MAQKQPPVREGSLNFKPKKQFIKRNKTHHVLLYGNSNSGIARLEIYESNKDKDIGNYTHLIVGSDIVKVSQNIVNHLESENTSFTIDTKDHQQYTFNAQSGMDCKDWVHQIQATMFAPSSPKQMENKSDSYTEDNDIYMPADELIREFKVNMSPETRQKLAADNPVRLLIENGHITIISLDGNRIIRWNIVQLRRIGYSADDFHIETGRKSERGPGNFYFKTDKGRLMHSVVNTEKILCRQNNNILPAGQVSCPVTPDPSSVPMGTNIYEEVVPVFRNQTQITKPNTSPPIPPEASSVNTPPISPGAWLGKKQASTLPHALRNNGFTGATSRNTTEEAIYTEPGVPPEPWKQFGRGDEEDGYANIREIMTDSTYDNLQRLNPVANNRSSDENPYSNYQGSPRPDTSPAYRESKPQLPQEKPKVITEPIYAQVNMEKKSNKKNRK